MRKYLFLALFIGLILLSSTIALADTYVTDRFLNVKLDTFFNDIELWEFHGTSDKNHDYACVSDYYYDNTYKCGLFISEEEGGSYDGFRIAWARDKALIKKSGTSLISDLGDIKKCGEYEACPTPSNPLIVATPCSSGAAFISPNYGGPFNTVLGKSYSTGWVNQCGLFCDLTKSGTEYRPKYDILCNKESDGTGKWYTCRDYSSCLGNWACDSSAGTWSDCAASDKTCSAGHCCLSGQTWDGTQCTSPPIPPPCSATLSISTGTGDPCNVAASVLAPSSGTPCANMNFKVKENGVEKCNGNTNGSGTGNCGSAFTQSAVAHSYDLYVLENGVDVKKDTRTGVGCNAPSGASGACTDPSGWNTKTGCESNSCSWCSFFTPSCVTPGTYCPSSSAYNCPAKTSESACNGSSGRCGWCADSYSGRTTASGGQCMKAEDLAGQCDSCYNAETYMLLRREARCSDRCASDASSYGYLGGWCISAQGSDGGWYPALCDSANKRCRCDGNEFASAKSYDRTVNCGECALSNESAFGVTVSRDCGGTAVRTEPEGKLANAELNSRSPGYSYSYDNSTWTIIPGAANIVSDPLLYFGLTSNTAGSPAHFSKIDIYVDDELFATLPEWRGYGYTPSPASAQLPKRFLTDGQVTVKTYVYYSGDNRGAVYASPRIGTYSYYSAPAECSGGLDNDRDCLVDCADSDCSANAACAGIPAKKSCGGPCGSCAGVRYNGASTTCQYGVCKPPKCIDIINQYSSTITFYDADNDGKISKTEANAALTDFFGGIITAAQARAMLDFYAQDCSVSANCRRQNPSVTISPAGPSGSPGQRLTYAVGITNNDNSACEALSFSLTKTCPSGWTCNLNQTSTGLISPGETDASSKMTVTSASSAGVGQYVLSVTAASGAYSGTADAKYNIECVPENPHVSFNPQAASGLPGDVVTSTVTVTNRNCAPPASDGCTLSATSTGSGTPTLNPLSLTLNRKPSASGISGTSTLSYTLPAAGAGSITVSAACGARSGTAVFGWTSGAVAASCSSTFENAVCTPYGYLYSITCNCNTYTCQ